MDLLETLQGNKSGSSSPSTTPNSGTLLSTTQDGSYQFKYSENSSPDTKKGVSADACPSVRPKIKLISITSTTQGIHKDSERIMSNQSFSSEDKNLESSPLEDEKEEQSRGMYRALEAKLQIKTKQIETVGTDERLILETNSRTSTKTMNNIMDANAKKPFKKRGISVPDYSRGLEISESKTIIPIDRHAIHSSSLKKSSKKSHMRSSPRMIPTKRPALTYDWTITSVPDPSVTEGEHPSEKVQLPKNQQTLARGMEQLMSLTCGTLQREDTMATSNDAENSPTGVINKKISSGSSFGAGSLSHQASQSDCEDVFVASNAEEQKLSISTDLKIPGKL